MNSNWWEISLGSEQEQELRGRLQFRRSSRSASESENVCYEEETIAKSNDDSKDEENQSRYKHTATDSAAYQLGMKFVYGAAKMVSTMADGGKENRDVIKKLRYEVDQSRIKCDELESEVKNSKEWIAYYENLKKELENQIEKLKEQFSRNYASVQEKLKRSEMEADICREELDKVNIQKDALVRDIEVAKSSAEKMKEQVEKAEEKIAEVHEKVSTTFFKPTANIATQVEYDCSLDSGLSTDRNLSEKLKITEDQLHDATRALQISLSQGQKLRQRLTTSLKSMKSHTFEMRQCRAALDSAAKETNESKTRLNEETQKMKEMESKLLHEKELHASLLLTLKDTEQLLSDIQSELRQEKSKAAKNSETFEKVVSELKFDYFAKTLVSDAITSAVTYQKIFLEKQFEVLQDDSKKMSNRLHATENLVEHWKEKVFRLETELQNKEAFVEEHVKQINALSFEVSVLRTKIKSKEELENKLRTALSVSETKQKQNETKFQEALKDKDQIVLRLNSLTRQLKNENSQLQFQIQQCSLKPASASAATQTDLNGSEVDQLFIQKASIENTNKLLTQQIKNANYEAHLMEKKNQSQKLLLAKLENEIATLKRKNADLGSSLQANELALYSKNQHLWQAIQECNRLYWECQQQNRRSVQLYNENLKWQNYFAIYFANSRSSSKTGCKSDFYNSAKYECRPSQEKTYSQIDNKSIKSGSGVSLETIKENEERLSATSSVASMQLKSETPLSSCCSTCSALVFSDGGFQEKSKPLCDDVKSGSQCTSKHSETPTQKTCTDVHEDHHNPFETDTLILKADGKSNANHSIDDDATYIASALQFKERLVGIPIPETVYDRIVAGEDVPSWHQDQRFSQDDGYSTSSCNSIKEELFFHHFQVTDCAGSPISEFTNLGIAADESEQNLHFEVRYRGKSFDMVSLSLPEIRNLASSTGAIRSQADMNDFYDFLAKKIKEMNGNPHLKNFHKLGSPTNWLSLKQET